MRAAVCDGDGSAVCARVGGLVLRARPEPESLNRASPWPSGSTACGFGAQAFHSASAFNANIGAWNTASVSNMASVCAARGPGGAHYGGRARPGFDAARPVVRGSTADALARAHTCRHSLARGLGCRYGRAEGRFGTCIRIYTYICVCVRVLHGCIYIHHPFICMCENGSGLCTRAPVCDGDGSAVCARVGGLLLRARPEPETLNRASPCPSGVDRVRPRRSGVPFGVGLQRQHRRVEHRVGVKLVLCMRRLFGPAARTMADALGRASMRRGPLCAAAPPMCARVRTRAGTRLRGALGVCTAARRGGSIHAF